MNKRDEMHLISRLRWSAALSALLFFSLLWVSLDSLLAIADAGGMREVEIPNFCGLREKELNVLDWMVLQTEYRHDEAVPAGIVIEQTPRAGSRRKLSENHPTCGVRLVVSLGMDCVHVPEVAGLDVWDALKQLRQEGFVVETVMVTGPYSEGTVIEIEPRVGTVLQRGGTVTITVSAGEPTETVTVPDLKGVSRSDALIRLWLSRLSVAEVVEEVSQQQGGTVLRQSHRAGTIVRAGTKITLYVAKEGSNEMEDLCTRDAEE